MTEEFKAAGKGKPDIISRKTTAPFFPFLYSFMGSCSNKSKHKVTRAKRAFFALRNADAVQHGMPDDF